MEPIVVIAILWLLGRGKKPETPVETPARGVSPSVTPRLTTRSGYQTPQTSQLPPAIPPNTSSTITPTFLDDERRRESSGYVDPSVIARPPSRPPTPVYRPPPIPRPAPAPVPPTIPSQLGVPYPQEPRTVVPIEREVPNQRELITSGGIPAFCDREYTPFLYSPCPGNSIEPAKRFGPPPAGTLVVTGPMMGASRSSVWPSCPDARGQGGIYYMEAGNPDWNVICPPTIEKMGI